MKNKVLNPIFIFVLLSLLTVSANAKLVSNYDILIEKLSSAYSLPKEQLLLDIEVISERENIDRLKVAEILLRDMSNESIIAENNFLVNGNTEMLGTLSTTIPASDIGNIWFSTATTSFYNHGHVALYDTPTSVVEARGSGYTVAIRSIYNIQAKSGDKVLAVKNSQTVNSIAPVSVRTAAINWAKGKIGSAYSYSVDNKSCGVHDYNCSQLVWCAYKNVTGSRDLDSDGTWFVSPSDIKNSSWVYAVWSY